MAILCAVPSKKKDNHAEALGGTPNATNNSTEMTKPPHEKGENRDYKKKRRFVQSLLAAH